MRRHDSLRASDADRDAVIDQLRQAAGEGRLEPDELEQRIDGALRARTYGELALLVADLPGDGSVVRRAGWRTIPIAQSAVLGAGLLVAVTVALALVALVVVLVLAAAAWWIALVLLWVACRGARRRHAHRTRPTGFL